MSIADNPIIITTQPEGKTAFVGTDVKFTVVATGSALTYQWQYSADDGETWANTTLPGNKTDTLTVPVTADRNCHHYRCKITSGSTVIYSWLVVLHVFPITIIAQPQNVTASVGDTVKFTVIAEGEGLRYRWMFKPWGKDCWSYTAPINRNTLTLPVTSDKHLTQYCCEVIDKNGCLVESERARLFAYIK